MSLFDLNLTEVNKSKFDSNLGAAQELIASGFLMRLGFDVAVSNVKGGPYDLLITVYTKGYGSQERIIRAQVKTCGKSVKFIGGIRAGADRTYAQKDTTKELVSKKYKYTTKDNDLIIGVQRSTCDMYLVPTVFLKHFGESKSTNKLAPLKNRWELLLNWNEKFLERLFREIISLK